MKVRGIALIAVVCAWSATAWATVVENGTTVTSNGQPLAGKTVVVEISQPAARVVTQTSTPARRVVHRVTVKTDSSGRVNFKYDDRKVDLRTATVRFVEVGGGLVSGDVPLSALGPFVALGTPGTSTPSGSPGAPSAPVRYAGEFAGFYIGGQGSGMPDWDQRITERIAGTRIVTNRLQTSQQAGGIGLMGGYDWGGFSGWTIGPVASINYIGQSNDNTFAGGFFIGTYLNWNATIGGKLGWQVNDRFLLYATGGAEFMNYDFRSNFAGPVLSINHTAQGWFFGGGVEYTQPDWKTSNGRWTAFGQITYNDFCGDIFKMPVFSPGFDYRIASEQIRATVGFTFRPNWGAPPPP